MLNNNFYILTVKDYLPKKAQLEVESEIAKYILFIWEVYKLRCIFIPTGANPIEENDLPVGERFAKIINNQKVFSVIVPKTSDAAKKIIGQAKFAVCTRMHSAIFAATEFVPFIALAYEHKSIGLLKSLNLDSWYINFREVNFNNLKKMTEKLLKKPEYNNFIKTLKTQRIHVLSNREIIKNQIFEYSLQEGNI